MWPPLECTGPIARWLATFDIYRAVLTPETLSKGISFAQLVIIFTVLLAARFPSELIGGGYTVIVGIRITI